ncbi:hypothetical protein Aau02nite_66900 [Amorphoplanes auranticolor]|uniref:Uncharacterized protein n=1 Tax=Actinoplanes auranticolor TaxID=47988 RepID=A0A919VTU6_9ACTN|nr:hypothetical protein Aau02nite_66900 [Actinoplanes auranticolor]
MLGPRQQHQRTHLPESLLTLSDRGTTQRSVPDLVSVINGSRRRILEFGWQLSDRNGGDCAEVTGDLPDGSHSLVR